MKGSRGLRLTSNSALFDKSLTVLLMLIYYQYKEQIPFSPSTSQGYAQDQTKCKWMRSYKQ